MRSGKSLEIIPQGTIHLKIGDQHYQWLGLSTLSFDHN